MVPSIRASSTRANIPPSSPRLRRLIGSDPTTATGSAALCKRISTRFTKRWSSTHWVIVLSFSLLLLTLRRTNPEWIDLCIHDVLPFRDLPVGADGRIWDEIIFLNSFLKPSLINGHRGGLKALTMLRRRRFIRGGWGGFQSLFAESNFFQTKFFP